ncbi:MAG: SufD family Fe-S cluster assembly protein [Lachnospiraceae bacterium]|nr:SufD family Fe-S cluster assembly protein [Lachnospiraceae bacterium]
MKINTLPVKTWNRLRMNDHDAEKDFDFKTFKYKEECPEGVKTGVITVGYDEGEANPEHFDESSGSRYSFGKGLRTGFGAEFKEALNKSGAPVTVYDFGEGKEYDTPLYQDFNFTGEANFGNIVEYRVGDGSSATVIQFVTSEGAGNSEIFIQSRYRLGKGARLTLVQIQTLEKSCTFYNDIGGRAEEDGEFNLIQIILGGKNNAYGVFSSLEGKRSSFTSELAYELGNDEKLDINYVADHTGAQTVSNINVSGVLKGSANKLFRGTIDFHRGCAGAKGAELEDVLMLDEGCENKTIPLILCDEEDVEGSHGASIGKPDEAKIYYMKSRGISEEEALRMIARSKIASVERKIKDERTRERLAKLHGEESL